MRVEQKEREIEQSGQIKVEEYGTYSLLLYAAKSQITRDYYLSRLRIFLNHISLLTEGTIYLTPPAFLEL
jgi:hypothetical protein